MDGSDIGTQNGLRIGRVIAVSASQAVALLERCDDSGGTDRPWPVEMGALVKVHTRVSTVYGMVSGMRVPLPNLAPPDRDWRVFEFELGVGTRLERIGVPGRFRGAVSAIRVLAGPSYSPSPAAWRRSYPRPGV